MRNSTLTPSQMYWRTNLRYLVVLLSIWFAVSFGASILFVEELNAFRVGGFKLGFWFAQQGSIYTFVVLIFVYIRLMNRLDAAYLNAAELSESGAEQKSTP
ncbi:MAG: DUF4212 domain-containing protein [Flavobacteriales bacterium]|jgi:putative solute:sodium symporter small subunit